jgi:hypothetical protein
MGGQDGGPIQMALELASSLRRLRRFLLNDVRLRYLTLFQREGTDTGPVSARVFELIYFGMEPGEAVAQVHRKFGGLTAGCNPEPINRCFRQTTATRYRRVVIAHRKSSFSLAQRIPRGCISSTEKC